MLPVDHEPAKTRNWKSGVRKRKPYGYPWAHHSALRPTRRLVQQRNNIVAMRSISTSSTYTIFVPSRKPKQHIAGPAGSSFVRHGLFQRRFHSHNDFRKRPSAAVFMAQIGPESGTNQAGGDIRALTHHPPKLDCVLDMKVLIVRAVLTYLPFTFMNSVLSQC